MKRLPEKPREFELNLLKSLLSDVYMLHQLSPRELQRDCATLELRTRAEGMGFLTKTLPKISKALDASLLCGTFHCPTEFRRYRKLPAFMRGLFMKVFSKSGVLLDTADPYAVKSIRQVGLLFYKYELPYDKRLVQACVDDFVETDESLIDHLTGAEAMSTVYYAKGVIDEIFKDFTYLKEDLRPKNGPGAVANGIYPFERYCPTVRYKPLDELVQYDQMFSFNDRHLYDSFDDIMDLDEYEHGWAKLIAVPKDSRGPRLISAEPSEFMTYQQALKNILVPFIESSPITGGQINFTDQSINGKLALSASITGALATIDLSKASDRLLLMLIELLYCDTPIYEHLLKARTVGTVLPGGRKVTFKKYAPMGSALTFPVQAITFYALLVGRRIAEGARLHDAAKEVWVYGDDIILPTTHTLSAIDALESVQLKVNTEKSCFNGNFRESCGVDAWSGVDVTPTKIKRLMTDKLSPQSVRSWIAYANNLWRDGYWRAADVIRCRIECIKKFRKRGLPMTSYESPILGWYTPFREYRNRGNHRHGHHCFSLDLQCTLVKGHTLTPKRIDVTRAWCLGNSGWERMLHRAWYNPLDDATASGPRLVSKNLDWFSDPDPHEEAFTYRHEVKLKRAACTTAVV